MNRQKLHRLVLAASLLLLSGLAAAQEVDPGGDPDLLEAIGKLEANDMQGAMQVLERMRTRSDAPVVGVALLGGLYVEAGQPLDALDVLEPLLGLQPPDAAVFYNAGRAAQALGQMQRAAELYQASVEILPSSQARRELGLMLGSRGIYTQALVLLKPWADQYPSDIEARLAAAFCAVQLERVPDAEQLLSDLPQDQPQVALLWSRLLLIKGDPWGAINNLTPMLDVAPDAMQLDLRRALAEAYAAVGQASDAVEVLKGYTENDPSVALQVALAQYQSGELNGALGTLRPFAESLTDGEQPSPTAARIVLHYGRFLAMTGEHESALPYLERATRLNPDEKQGWQMLGQTLAGLGRRDEAQVALERFQEISKGEISASKQELQSRAERDDPTLAAIREAYEMMSQERFEEALARVRQERAIARNDLRPILLEGRLLTILERHDEALAVAEQVVQAAPENPDAYYLRGTVHMSRKSFEAAEVDFRQALVLQPQHTATMNDLAVLLINTGKTTEARALLEQVLEFNPNDEIAAQNLSSIEG